MNALSEASHRTNEVAAPIAERTALTAIRVNGEDPWAHHALGIAYLFMRPFDDSLAESSWHCGSTRTSRWHKAITA